MKTSVFSTALLLAFVTLAEARIKKNTEDEAADKLEDEFSKVLGGSRGEKNRQKKRHLSGGKGGVSASSHYIYLQYSVTWVNRNP
jgi:hypothetical protein